MTGTITVTRAFTADLEADGDGRTIIGRCVPYDTPTMVADPGEPAPYLETWRPGVFKRALKDPTRVHLVFAHDETAIGNRLGYAVTFRDEPAGLDATFRTVGAPGDQALELIRAGMARGLSIHAAVSPSGSRTRTDGVVERTQARLIHVALVTEPAFADAKVTAIRAASSDRHPSLAEVRAMQAERRLRFTAEPH
jgi:HK97 family phage prohead protease